MRAETLRTHYVMNKTFRKNALLALALAFFALLSCDRRSEEEKRADAIAAFVMDYAHNYNSYKVVDLKKIDEAYLEGQQIIKSSLKILQDTTRTKLSYLALSNSQMDMKQLVSWSEKLPIDAVDSYLTESAKVDRLLNQHWENAPTELTLARQNEATALNSLNDALALFNLSIYSINLGEGSSSLYYHQFEVDGMEKAAIFEVDNEALDVIAYKELG
ncbi:hypothetical protein BXY85_1770 [Roseivirga pacifica]|uniref:Uncharacterized protein n=2 Tax=Roseivirga pacifica TaxID=1267423 RepID=A0A1I0MX24_9BACT|nr:hypothetical protein BXY85_1770 [Roseivirga pacifica]SEV93018.1 hypothetical protein SAMN05216290_0753 [Roseivirga pacifica]